MGHRCIALALLLFSAPLFASGEWMSHARYTDSMLPVIRGGDLCIWNVTPFGQLHKGDIVATFAHFNGQWGLVSHRLYKRTRNGWMTKGDANRWPDSWITTPQNYRGRLVEVVHKP